MKEPVADTLANKVASKKLSCASEDMESWAAGCADVLDFGESRSDIFKPEKRPDADGHHEDYARMTRA
jgi:hypothetical protein